MLDKGFNAFEVFVKMPRNFVAFQMFMKLVVQFFHRRLEDFRLAVNQLCIDGKVLIDTQSNIGYSLEPLVAFE